MKTGAIAAFVCTLVLTAAAQTPEQQVVNDAATALGGRDRIVAVKTMLLEGAGSFVGITSCGPTMTSSGRQSNSSATGGAPTWPTAGPG
jgi:hypothetical protein